MSAAPERHHDPIHDEPAAAPVEPVTPAPAGKRGDRSRITGYGAFDPREKSPLLASFLSAIPGLGQIYVGYYAIGFLHAVVVAGTISLLAADVLGDATPLGGLFLPFFWLYNIVDAGRRAAFYNLAVEGGEELPLPGELPTAGSAGGLVPVGVALVLLGGIFLSHTAFDLSLRWLEDWWPMGPILLGAYLIARGAMERKSGNA